MRKRTNEPPAILELLLPLIGLMLVAVFLLPGFRQFLGTVLFVGAGAAVLSVIVGMGLYTRHLRQLAANPPGGAPDTPPGAWTVDLLARLDWKRFEELAAAYYREMGYDAKPAPDAPAGRTALVLNKKGKTQPAMIMQCQAWDRGAVDDAPIRALFATMETADIGYGVFHTCGDFTAAATAFARGKILDLVTGAEFIHRIQQLTPAVQQSLLEEATQGDFSTPTCPGCDIKMVPGEKETGPADNGKSWVCRNHPQCQQVLPRTAAG